MLKSLLGKTIEVNAAKKAYEPEDKPRRTKVFIECIRHVLTFELLLLTRRLFRPLNVDRGNHGTVFVDRGNDP